MESLTKVVEAPKREGEVRESTRDMNVRAPVSYDPRGFNKVDCVVVMLEQSSRNSQNVSVEYDVLRWEVYLFS